jgi:hypothetical protein
MNRLPPDQERILRDLGHKFMDHVMKGIDDMDNLCKVIGIPDRSVTQTTTGILLNLVMHLTHAMVPKLTPREFADLSQQQFTYFLRQLQELREEINE